MYMCERESVCVCVFACVRVCVYIQGGRSPILNSLCPSIFTIYGQSSLWFDLVYLHHIWAQLSMIWPGIFTPYRGTVLCDLTWYIYTIHGHYSTDSWECAQAVIRSHVWVCVPPCARTARQEFLSFFYFIFLFFSLRSQVWVRVPPCAQTKASRDFLKSLSL